MNCFAAWPEAAVSSRQPKAPSIIRLAKYAKSKNEAGLFIALLLCIDEELEMYLAFVDPTCGSVAFVAPKRK